MEHQHQQAVNVSGSFTPALWPVALAAQLAGCARGWLGGCIVRRDLLPRGSKPFCSSAAFCSQACPRRDTCRFQHEEKHGLGEEEAVGAALASQARTNPGHATQALHSVHAFIPGLRTRMAGGRASGQRAGNTMRWLVAVVKQAG